ncbi:MAG: ComEC/Rec2 family competence protein [Candidatus Omnitrophota bacterium]
MNLLTVFTFIFCLGIAVAAKFKVNFAFFYFAAVIFLIFSFRLIKRKLIFDIFLISLVFSLGLLFFTNTEILPKNHISQFPSYKSTQPYLIKGSVKSEPVIRNKKSSFIFKTEEIQFDDFRYTCCGDILVNLVGKNNFLYGDELILKGTLGAPSNFKSQAQANYRDYLHRQGIYAVLAVKTDFYALKLNKNRGFGLKIFALRLKEKIEQIIFRYLPTVPAGILDAMVLGEKRNIPPLINISMMQSGTVHILVVSGFNVGIVAFIIAISLRLLRIPRHPRNLATILLLVVYCFATGATTPVVRATVMASIFISSYFFKREADVFNALSISALCILINNPQQLFDIGFQLSFISVLSILCIYPRLKSFFNPLFFKHRYFKFITDGLLVSISAWLGTMGFIIYYFKIFSPITILANLFIVPLASLITLCGFSLIAVSLVTPLFAPFFASSIELIVAILLKINFYLIKLPGAYFYL